MAVVVVVEGTHFGHWINYRSGMYYQVFFENLRISLLVDPSNDLYRLNVPYYRLREDISPGPRNQIPIRVDINSRASNHDTYLLERSSLPCSDVVFHLSLGREGAGDCVNPWTSTLSTP